jgi:hypothetical protein
MIEQKPKLAFSLILVGVILMFANVLLVGMNGAPTIVSSGKFESPNEIIGTKANSSWFRVSFGLKGWVEGSWAPVWLITTMIMLYCALRLYIKPLERKTLSLTMAVLSVLSLIYGGGFLIGAILGIVGSGLAFSWPAKSENAFFYKIMRAARLDSKFYRGLSSDENSLKHATYALAFANILSGVGVGVYSYVSQRIINASSSNTPFRIILLGEMPMDLSVITTVVVNVGLAMFKWLILSGIVYAVAAGLLERKQKLSNIASAVAFAYIPISLQFFMPFILPSRPGLAFNWPMLVFAVTNIWVALAFVIGVGQSLETNLGKTLGVVSISSAIYLLIQGTFFVTLDVPNIIRFTIQPQSALLVVVSALVLGSLLFETYTKR